MPWLDPVLAVVVGFIICHTAWGIFRSSSLSLTDGISKKEIDKLKETIYQVEDVVSVKNVKARYYGSNLIVDLVIELNKSLTLEEVHDITDLVEERVKTEHRAIDVHVHVEPGY